MKSTILFALFLSFLLQNSCMKQTGNLSNTNTTENVQMDSSVVSSDTAMLVAKGYLCFDYDLKNYDISTTEKEDIWEVRFSSKKQGNYGYGPVVFVSRINGELKGGVHSK